MKSCQILEESQEIKCDAKNCKNAVLERVKVFDLAGDGEYHYTNITAEEALISAYLQSTDSINLSNSETRKSLVSKIVYGRRSIGLGDFSTTCGMK